jgi:hypothetical protein
MYTFARSCRAPTTCLVLAASLISSIAKAEVDAIDVKSLLREMVDLKNLAERPEPFFTSAAASSYSRESHKGGQAWFDNGDVGQYIRTETNEGRKEHVLADLKGPGAITRFWSANPRIRAVTRFYFDGEKRPRFAVPLAALFTGKTRPFSRAFSYVSGSGGNLYFPLPYAVSLKITIEEKNEPVSLYYEIGYRTYATGTHVETFDPTRASNWSHDQVQIASALSRPMPAAAPSKSEWLTYRLTIQPGDTQSLPEILGEKAVFQWSAQVLDTCESQKWDDPLRAHNAYRLLLLDIRCDGESSVRTPLGDFFGSAPGVNPYENMFFTVAANGKMTSRLLMPFKRSMRMSLTNAGKIPYAAEVKLHVGEHVFTDRSYHLRAQWGSQTRNTRPFFDMNFLKKSGEGKLIGTVYEIANPVLIWWGEGDQKIFIDGEAFPSTFGTGTEDDYGYAYGYNRPFTRPYHAQTRVDGPASGGHVSLNRWYVLDSLPYRTGIQFNQEIWHWMPCKPTWAHVIYWYAKPGTAGPTEIDRQQLLPPDLGIRANMLDPLEGEDLIHEETGGTAERQWLANCSRAAHLVWHDAKPGDPMTVEHRAVLRRRRALRHYATPGDRLTVHFTAPQEGLYKVELNLCMSPNYGRQKLSINGQVVCQAIDGYSAELSWMQAKLGPVDLKKGDNILVAEALEPNSQARPGNLFGLDYIFLIRQ